jgi:predicted TIM-barrel fold metal-dependent hydrolase
MPASPSFALRACALALSLAAPWVAAADEHYTMADFERVPKIDAHLHLHGQQQEAFLALARKANFRALTINVDYPDFPALPVQQRVAGKLHREHPGVVGWIASFGVEGVGQPAWPAATRHRIDGALAQGAVGVKVWKNIGMSLRDAAGKLVMVDDARLRPLFDGLEADGVLVVGHQGEPRNCWLPLEQMTVKNDRIYFRKHPQYHMYRQPHMPSYEDQMGARDRLLERHPRLRFVGVHLASLEWSVDELARFLDRHPDASVDVAARVGQLQVQSQRDRERVRRFFIDYQDRLIYGSDLAQPARQGGQAFAAELEAVWRRDWRYFSTAELLRTDEVDGPVRGLALPKAVADKLFRLNAERVYAGAWNAPLAAGHAAP